MTFTSPVQEQRFVLDHVANIGALAETDLFADAEPELVSAILEGAGALAAGEWANTNRTGDAHHPQWHDGGVTMPPTFGSAYRAFVDGGWGTISASKIHGGQGLPNVLSFAVMESLSAANMGFGLCPILTAGAVEALTHHGSKEQRALYFKFRRI